MVSRRSALAIDQCLAIGDRTDQKGGNVLGGSLVLLERRDVFLHGIRRQLVRVLHRASGVDHL